MISVASGSSSSSIGRLLTSWNPIYDWLFPFDFRLLLLTLLESLELLVAPITYPSPPFFCFVFSSSLISTPSSSLPTPTSSSSSSLSPLVKSLPFASIRFYSLYLRYLTAPKKIIITEANAEIMM